MALRRSLLVGITMLLVVPQVMGAGSGSISLNSMTTETGKGEPSQNNFITANYGNGSYLVAPWVMTWGARVGLSQFSGSGGTTTTDGQTWTGSLSADVLPRSRFPLSMSLEISDSRVQTQTELSPEGVTGTTRSRIFRARENYTSYDGTMVNLWYNNAQWEGVARSNASSTTSNSFGVLAAKRFDNQTLNFSGTEFQTDSGRLGGTATSRSLSLSHTYSPATQSGVTTLLTQTTTATSAAVGAERTTSVMTGSSNFYWRPDYRPLSVTGGLRLTDNRTNQGGATQSLGLNVSASYALSRSLRMSAAASGSIQDTQNGQSGNASQNIGVNYTGDPVYLGRMTYGWGTGVNASNQMTRGAGAQKDTQTASTSFNHNLQRAWQLGERSTLNASIGQGLSYSHSSQGTSGTGISHSTRLGWNTNDENSTTAAWISFTDSRSNRGGGQVTGATATAGTTGTSGTQTLMANLRRTQNVSRLSSLTADIILNANRSLTNDSLISRSISGNAEYQHSRVFGVYRLRFTSALGLSQASALQGAQNISSRWSNRLDYNIGMLMVSANFNITQTATNQTRMMMFQVTRNF